MVLWDPVVDILKQALSSLIHPVSMWCVCTTLLPTIHCEHCKGRGCVGFAIFLWCLIGTQCGYQP